jgi:hypothetical protein
MSTPRNIASIISFGIATWLAATCSGCSPKRASNNLEQPSVIAFEYIGVADSVMIPIILTASDVPLKDLITASHLVAPKVVVNIVKLTGTDYQKCLSVVSNALMSASAADNSERIVFHIGIYDPQTQLVKNVSGRDILRMLELLPNDVQMDSKDLAMQVRNLRAFAEPAGAQR